MANGHTYNFLSVLGYRVVEGVKERVTEGVVEVGERGKGRIGALGL